MAQLGDLRRTERRGKRADYDWGDKQAPIAHGASATAIDSIGAQKQHHRVTREEVAVADAPRSCIGGADAKISLARAPIRARSTATRRLRGAASIATIANMPGKNTK